MNSARSFVSLAVLLSSTVASAQKTDWEQVSERDGVKVYRRAHPASPIHSLKGSGIVDASVAVVAGILVDCERAHEWVDSLAANRVVRQVHAKEYVEYNHASMPFVVSDRDFVTRVTMEVKPERRTTIIRSEPNVDSLAPERSGIVRGTMRAVYVLEATEDGKGTHLTVEIHADPKGALPAWIVNFFQKDWSHETIAGIRKQAKKPDLTRPERFRAYLAELDFPAAGAAASGAQGR